MQSTPIRRRPLLALAVLVLFTLACYSMTLSLQINEGGGGLMTLITRIYIGDEEPDTASLVEQLTEAGWRVSGPVEIQGETASLVAQYEFGPNADLSAQLRAIPGFDESNSRLTIVSEQAEGLEHRRYTLDSSLDMSQHQAFWSFAQEVARNGLEVDCEDTPLDLNLLGEDEEDCVLEITPQEAQAIIDETGPINFRLQVLLPGELEEYNGPWDSTDPLTVNWSASSGPARLPMRAVSVLQPERELDDPDQLNANLDRLLDRFETEIPAGQVVTSPTTMQNYLAGAMDFFGNGPGTANNMTGGGFACGDYQAIVTNWLDSIRLSQDPAQRGLLDGWDYGPVQAYYGGHQAVVLYPKGTNWQRQGIILDPWPTQIPTFYTFEEWDDKFWGIGPGEGHQDYPHITGGDPHYPDTRTQANRLHFRRISVNSPVAALALRADGARLGYLANGEFVNEIPGADFYANPMPDGTTQTYFGLPEGEYQLDLMGTDAGEVHVLVGDGSGELVSYGSQPIDQNGQMGLSLAPDQPFASELTLPDGSAVGYQEATVEGLQAILAAEDQPALGILDQIQPQSDGGLPPRVILLVLCLLCLFGASMLALAGGLIWAIRRRRAT